MLLSVFRIWTTRTVLHHSSTVLHTIWRIWTRIATNLCTRTVNWARIMELNDFQFWAEWWSSTIPGDTHISANSAPALFKRSANWPRLHDLFRVKHFFVARAQQNYSAPPTTTSCFWRSFSTSAEMTDLMVSSSFLPAALQIYVVRESNQSLFFKRQNESMKLHFMEVKWQHL